MICFILLLGLVTLPAHSFIKQKLLSIAWNDAHRVPEDYVKINNKVSPCDDFFEFVCGADRSKSSLDLQEENFFHSFIKAVHADKKYPNIAKSIISHLNELQRFQSNETHQINILLKFLKSFGYLPFLSEPVNNESQFIESLLRLIFLQPEIFSKDNLVSPLGIKYDFYSDNNTLLLQASTSDAIFNLLWEADGKPDNFAEYFKRSAWNVYENLVMNSYKQLPGYDNTTYEQVINVTDFANLYFNITAKSDVNSMANKPLGNLINKNLQKAIIKTLSRQMNEAVDVVNLKVTIDEQLFEDLLALFLSKPKEGQHFILSMALLTLSYSVDLQMSPFADEIVNLNDTYHWYFDHVLHPHKSGEIFNLYAADLVIRNRFPVTSVKEILTVRSLVEKIRFSIKRSLFATNFLKDSQSLITVLNLLDSVTINVGLPKNVYKSENFVSELKNFAVFHTGDDLIDQIIKLRISNFRLRNRLLSSRKSYFSTVFDFDTDSNSLSMSLLPFQVPNYDISYPDSYNIGNFGTVIGHELFHCFAPPNHQESWDQERKFNESLECYKSFYHEKICYDLNLYNPESGNYKWRMCASDFKDPFTENIPDVEGARAAFRVLKEMYKTNLKDTAMPQFSHFNFTHEQLFFVAFANKLCGSSNSNNDNRFSWALYSRDPHQPAKVRINAVALQMSEFATAFNCKATDSMVLLKQQRCYMLPSD